MGACLSKKSTSSPCPAAVPKTPNQIKPSPTATQLEKKKQLDQEPVKKEIFIIKHRKSHDVERRSDEESGDGNKKATQEVSESGKAGSDNNSNNNGGGIFVAAPMRTSSCTKEEVDAILIQCGRLSRSSSTDKANFPGSCGSGENENGSSQKGRKYSGSKRSYDFDGENGCEGRDSEKNAALDDDNGAVGESSHRHRQRHRQSRTAGSPSKGRRRTPSREREQGKQGPRSGSSRERGGGNGSSGSGRRVSRSPGRRSESPITTSCGVSAGGNSSSSGNCNTGNVRPGKMVSVPATVSSSLAVDKSNNNGVGGGADSISASGVKRIQVKRNAGADAAAAAARTAASPRSRSPAKSNIKVLNENQQQQQPGSLGRSNSRKAEHSPFRRNPLSEIDNNVVVSEQPTLPGTKVPYNVVSLGTENKTRKAIAENSLSNPKEQQQAIASNLAVNVVASGPECLKPQAVTRSRSSRLSRDLDINPETLSNNSPSYTALLLEDIQNFHQKSSAPAITLPACLSKACSILEAVADLNSSTGSNLSGVFSEDKRGIPTVEQFNKYYDNASFGATPTTVKKGLENKDPFVQSEVVVSDDIMKPSFHKYVTTRRGSVGGEDMEEQESSGSNSFVAGQQHWASPSSWEPNSADSTDRWTSSRSENREENQSPLELQRHDISESGHDAEEARKRLNGGKKRESDQQQNGIGRGRIVSRGIHSTL